MDRRSRKVFDFDAKRLITDMPKRSLTRFGLLATFFVLLSSATVAQTAIPDTRAGKALTDYLAAFNKADEARFAKFSKDYHFSGKIQNQLAIARNSGGFTVLRVEESESNSITVLVADHSDDLIARGTLTLETDTSGQPTKCTIVLRITDRPVEYAIPRLSQRAALRALKERAASLAKDDKFSGAYLIAQDGKMLAANTYGWENREAKIPITLNSKFRIGSINKVFTAVAILQLIDAGKIKLEGKVGDYLPNYQNKDVATKVTVRHLLSMTGGTGDVFGPKYDANRLNLKTHSDYVALFGSRAPDFEPGTKDSYSNYGYILLGRIIEKVSGESYYDFVAQHVFAPAGMNDTASAPEDEFVPRRVIAYTWEGNRWSPAQDKPYRGTAGGGGYTTVGDMLKFARALQADKLLPGRLVADATIPHDHGGGTGYGFELRGKGVLQSYGKSGGAPGQSAQFRVYPAFHRIVVVLSNFDPLIADNLATFYDLRMPASP